MTDHSFSESLVRKSERAVQIARLSLENEDPDSAVNRSYYAMFNISRAALLNAGVAEGELPRTHRGISEAGLEAVPPGEIEDGHSRDEQGSAAGGVADEMEEARRRGREEWLELQKQKLESGAPTLEQRRKKGVEDWLNLKRQQNRPVKDPKRERDSSADLEGGEGANDSTKGSDDDLDP